MAGSEPIPVPVVDHGQTLVDAAAAPPAVPWQPPVPSDPLNLWTPIPLNPVDGNPAWPPIVPGYPNGPWDPFNPQPGLNGRTITFHPGPPAVLTIHCGGGYYQIPWAKLCNPDAPKAVPAPSGNCVDDPWIPQRITAVAVVKQTEKYIRELSGSVQITCTIEYTITTQDWICVYHVWTPAPPRVTQTYTERSYIFPCCC